MIDVLTCYWSNSAGRCMISMLKLQTSSQNLYSRTSIYNPDWGEIGLGRYLLRVLIRYVCLRITIEIYGGRYQRPLRAKGDKPLYFIENWPLTSEQGIRVDILAWLTFSPAQLTAAKVPCNDLRFMDGPLSPWLEILIQHSLGALHLHHTCHFFTRPLWHSSVTTVTGSLP